MGRINARIRELEIRTKHAEWQLLHSKRYEPSERHEWAVEVVKLNKLLAVARKVKYSPVGKY